MHTPPRRPPLLSLVMLLSILVFSFQPAQAAPVERGNGRMSSSTSVELALQKTPILTSPTGYTLAGFTPVYTGVAGAFRLLGGPAHVSISPERVHIAFTDSVNPLELRFLGAASDGILTPLERQTGIYSEFFGQDAGRWIQGAPTFAALESRQLYPGIDLRWVQSPAGLKSTFILAPGADPAAIRWRYAGIESVRLNEDGAVEVTASAEGQPQLVDQAPVAWQVRLGRKITVSAAFTLAENAQLGFNLGSYDDSLPLVIDPTLEFSTYLGGSSDDRASAVVAGPDGSVYVTGWTNSADFPSNPPVAVPYYWSAFVTHISVSGSILFSTAFGGSMSQNAEDIELDAAGNIIVCGYTYSEDFPLKDPIQSTFGGDNDSFIFMLSPDGASLLFSTYFGGPNSEYTESMAISSSGRLVVEASVEDGGTPTTPGAYDTSANGGTDSVLYAVDLNQKQLLYSTYLGGSEGDYSENIAINDQLEPVLIGFTWSPDFPLVDPYQPQYGGGTCMTTGCYDGFVVRLSADGSSLLYSTYLGGRLHDYPRDVTVDTDGGIIVFGSTDSPDFPVANALQSINLRGDYWGDFFITKFTPAGDELVYSTFFGGMFDESGFDFELDASGRIYIFGTASEGCIPALTYLRHPTADALLVVLEPNAAGVASYQYLGGLASENAMGLALSTNDRVWIAGETSSTDYPLVRPFDSVMTGNDDGFVSLVQQHFPYTQEKVYLPLANKGSAGGIFGQALRSECGLENIKLELRYWDGSRWSTRAVTYTRPDGTFTFADVPSLRPGEKYFVRYTNESASSFYMSFYNTRSLTSYSQGMPLEIERFWLEDFYPGEPYDDWSVSMPATFTWYTNIAHPEDSYELVLYSKQTSGLIFRSGPLGFTNQYVFESLPPGFETGKEYYWYVAVYTASGGYGESLDQNNVRFTE